MSASKMFDKTNIKCPFLCQKQRHVKVKKVTLMSSMKKKASQTFGKNYEMSISIRCYNYNYLFSNSSKLKK